MKDIESVNIAIIGLGYVGLPLAVEFGKRVSTVGFDINKTRIAELDAYIDSTLETTAQELQEATKLSITDDKEKIRGADVYIITVPTPVDEDRRPDLSHVESASELVAGLLSVGSIVVYESTVYPGCTNEVCVPILEQFSGLQHNRDFYTGYSPERINPGDKHNRLPNIIKITSGSTAETADFIDNLYQRIITAGTYKAASVQVAEAAKVIENVQRDVNIALVNELAMIFKRLQIDTLDVLNAAGSKWNFLPFKPGLVGGHCIGVDPYYLCTKSERLGYKPKIISAAREINEALGELISNSIMNMMTQKRIHIVDSRMLILGLSFKENCPDLRNTRVVDIINCLTTCNAIVDVYDPWVNGDEAYKLYGIRLIRELKSNRYDAVVMAVSHSEFLSMSVDDIRGLGKENCIIYDVKSMLDRSIVDGRL